MAVGRRASGSGSITQAAGASLTLTKPSGVADGDLLVMWIQTDASNTLSGAGIAGWTQDQSVNTAGGQGSWLFWKIASSEPASYAISTTPGNVYGITISAYTGAASTQPDVATQTSTGTTASASVPATATTPSAGCFELACFSEYNGGSFTTPTGFTATVANNTNGASLYVFDQGPLTPSAVLPSVSSTDSVPSSWAGAHFVIRASVPMVGIGQRLGGLRFG